MGLLAKPSTSCRRSTRFGITEVLDLKRRPVWGLRVLGDNLLNYPLDCAIFGGSGVKDLLFLPRSLGPGRKLVCLWDNWENYDPKMGIFGAFLDGLPRLLGDFWPLSEAKMQRISTIEIFKNFLFYKNLLNLYGGRFWRFFRSKMTINDQFWSKILIFEKSKFRKVLGLGKIRENSMRESQFCDSQ